MNLAADHAAPRPALAGIGLRSPHVGEVMATRPSVGFLEVHAENYMAGGPALASLERLRADYPVSVHAVGLSLGGPDELDARHLARLKSLVDRIEPVLVSEHLAWSVAGGVYFNHLLPLPYDKASLDVVCRRVTRVQEMLGRTILVENPSLYLRFRRSTIPEGEFLAALVERTGCGLLLDVNNVYVSCRNFGEDPAAYLDAIDPATVGEVHLAGHAENEADGRTILIDDHGSPVAEPVWQLHARMLERLGPVPTLVEWDTSLPALDVLLAEAAKAGRLLEAAGRRTPDAVRV
jgi:uncharacterized protein (UPF0276 family)